MVNGLLVPLIELGRLRVYANASADVLDMDGRQLAFGTHEDASNYLREDEYVTMDSLTDEDYAKLRLHREQLIPPIAQSDAELVSLLFVKR